MNYLIYIERAAENLQFFLWLRSYIARFDKLPEELKAIAPAISLEKLEAEQQSARPKSSAGKLGREAAALFREADFDAKDVAVQERAVISPFDDSDSADADRPHGPASPWADDTATVQSSTKRSSNFQQIAANAFEAADVKLQPCERALLHSSQSLQAFIS